MMKHSMAHFLTSNSFQMHLSPVAEAGVPSSEGTTSRIISAGSTATMSPDSASGGKEGTCQRVHDNANLHREACSGHMLSTSGVPLGGRATTPYCTLVVVGVQEDSLCA